MFILKDYLKKGFLNAIGKMSDYQIILNSVGYHEKGVLTEEDLAEIEEKINEQYPQVTDEQITNDVIEIEQSIGENEVISQ